MPLSEPKGGGLSLSNGAPVLASQIYIPDVSLILTDFRNAVYSPDENKIVGDFFGNGTHLWGMDSALDLPVYFTNDDGVAAVKKDLHPNFYAGAGVTYLTGGDPYTTDNCDPATAAISALGKPGAVNNGHFWTMANGMMIATQANNDFFISTDGGVSYPTSYLGFAINGSGDFEHGDSPVMVSRDGSLVCITSALGFGITDDPSAAANWNTQNSGAILDYGDWNADNDVFVYKLDGDTSNLYILEAPFTGVPSSITFPDLGLQLNNSCPGPVYSSKYKGWVFVSNNDAIGLLKEDDLTVVVIGWLITGPTFTQAAIEGTMVTDGNGEVWVGGQDNIFLAAPQIG